MQHRAMLTKGQRPYCRAMNAMFLVAAGLVLACAPNPDATDDDASADAGRDAGTEQDGAIRAGAASDSMAGSDSAAADPAAGAGGAGRGASGVDEGGASNATDTIVIYFSRGDSAVAVTRSVPADSAGLDGSLRQLLRGPTASERAAGLHSWFSAETAGALRAVALQPGGKAIVDFADLRELIPNASSSAGSAMLLRELNATVFEHRAVQSVEYRIEGSCDIFGEWLQYGCVTIGRGTRYSLRPFRL